MTERAKNVALSLSVLVALDLAGAQAYNRILPRLGPQPEPVRELSSVYHHDLRKNVDGWSFWGPHTYRFLTNDLGFRDERVRKVSRCSDEARLLLLGDSFTEGLGVAYPETFAGLLARELGPRGVEVLNAAVVSYSPAIYYRKTKYLLEELALDLDMLVVFIDGSDVLDEVWLDDHGRTRVVIDEDPATAAPRRRRPIFEQAKHVLRQYSLIMMAAARIRLVLQERLGERGRRARMALDAEEVAWDYDPDVYRQYGEEGFRRAAANMDSLLALARRHNLPMAVVVYPWPDHVFRRMLDSRQVTFWREWSRVGRVSFFDLFPAFIDERDPEATIREYYTPYDSHWSAAGHRRVAESVLEAGLGDFIAAAKEEAAGRPSGSCPRSAANRAGTSRGAATPR